MTNMVIPDVVLFFDDLPKGAGPFVEPFRRSSSSGGGRG